MLWSRQKDSLGIRGSKPGFKFRQLFRKKSKREWPESTGEIQAELEEEETQETQSQSDLHTVGPQPSPHPSVQIELLRESLSTVVAPKPPSTHLRIKAKETNDQLLSPHRSPPSRPYTPTSTTSSSGVTNSTGSMDRGESVFASIDEEEPVEMHENTENTSLIYDEGESHDPNPFARAPVATRTNSMEFPPSRSPAREFARRESVMRDDSSSIYSPSVRLSTAFEATPRLAPRASPNTGPYQINATAPTTAKATSTTGITPAGAAGGIASDETWFQQRANGWKRNKNRISSVLPQQYREKPLTRKAPPEIAIPVRRRPVMRPPPDPELVRNGTTKSSRRVSVASSLSSILPYIIRYNNLSAEEVNQPQQTFTGPQIDISGIQDTYTSVEHVELAESQSIYEQNRRIEELLRRRNTPPPVQPLHIRKPVPISAPCQAGVREYAQQLDLEFKQFEGVEPDYQFREQILRGTSYSVQRRSRLLDKDLPALPDFGDRVKRLDTFRSKLKMFV